MQGIPTTVTMPPIGAAIEGGFYAGLFQAAGEIYGLIVAPKAGGDLADQAWHDTQTEVAGVCSYCDGPANTTAMAEAGSPLAQAIRALSINGHADWYMPSRDEIELVYRHLKPGTASNYAYRSGDNPSSLPPGYPYTAGSPVQTSVRPFQAGGDEALEEAWYWSSTQYSRNYAWVQVFVDGFQTFDYKSFQGRARAVRRFIP